MARSNLSPAVEAQLAEFLAGFYDDPYGFVMAVFPWGQPTLADGSFNPLHDKDGPEPWQREELQALGDHIKANKVRREIGLDMEVWKSAVASGHGVGKSAMVAWLIYFLMSTRTDTRGVVTANTQAQLENRTWPELAKWHNLALNKHWFVWGATSFSFAPYPDEKRKNYLTTAATVSEHNTEAFAGLHNEGKTVFVVFDEASGIHKKIWEVSEGALTDGEAFFFAYGNPTQPDGEFADCFEKHSHLYRTRHIDSRSVSHTNKLALQGILDKYGEDSDQARIRVKGMFPSASIDAFIPMQAVREAQAREDYDDSGAGLIMGVDGSRSETGDKFRVSFRQGRDARSITSLEYPGMRTQDQVRVVSGLADQYKPDAIVIEGTGPTTGLIDIMKERRYPVVEVFPGAPADEFEQFQNKRIEWWYNMREWIWEEGVLPDSDSLRAELTSIHYGHQRQTRKMFLEAKEDMRSRGLSSPDEADSLALTFAVRVARRDRNRHWSARADRKMAITQDDPFS